MLNAAAWHRGGEADYPLKPSRMPVIAAVLALAFILSNCSGKPNVDPRLGAIVSPRVVEEGQPVPKGGGSEVPAEPQAVMANPSRRSGNAITGVKEGLASWYGGAFHGRRTSNGEVFDKESISAAHPSFPLPSYARVTNVNNGKSIVVRVNDRGPFHGGRVLDVSERTADILNFKRMGMARVRIDYIGPAPLKGGDEQKLLATYAEDNTPLSPVQVASLLGGPAPASATTNAIDYRLAAAHQIVTPRPKQAVAAASQRPAQPDRSQSGYALAAVPPEPVPTPVSAETTPAARIESRIDRGFAGVGNPQPLTQQTGAMSQPVLGSMAFNPLALTGIR